MSKIPVIAAALVAGATLGSVVTKTVNDHQRQKTYDTTYESSLKAIRSIQPKQAAFADCLLRNYLKSQIKAYNRLSSQNGLVWKELNGGSNTVINNAYKIDSYKPGSVLIAYYIDGDRSNMQRVIIEPQDADTCRASVTTALALAADREAQNKAADAVANGLQPSRPALAYDAVTDTVSYP